MEPLWCGVRERKRNIENASRILCAFSAEMKKCGGNVEERRQKRGIVFKYGG